jgi:hypothetical protein
VKRLPRAALAATGLALFVLATGACGKKGPPVAPELRLPAAPSNLRASVEERRIVLSWQNPTSRFDNSRLRDLPVLRVFRREEAAGAAPKPAMRSGDEVVGYSEIARIRMDAGPPPGVEIQGGSVRFTDEKGLSLGKRYIYVVTAEDSIGRVSPPSERLDVTLLVAPAAPSGLTIVPGDKQVRLRWEAPTVLIDGGRLSGEMRYLILRAVGDGPLTAITPEPVSGTSYTDAGLENDVTYRYAVQAVRVEAAGAARGPASAAVASTPVDTTPPSAPTNLVVIPGGGAMRLAWNPSPEEDVVLYAIYRAVGDGELIRIGATQTPTTVFVDRDVSAGTRYRYAVTAIDRARNPNESPRSNIVTVTAE